MRLDRFSLVATTGLLLEVRGVFSQSQDNSALVRLNSTIVLGTPSTVIFRLGDTFKSGTSIILGQTTQATIGGAGGPKIFNKIAELAEYCIEGGSCPSSQQVQNNNLYTVQVAIAGPDPTSFSDYFLCLTDGIGSDTCLVYSDLFSIIDSGQGSASPQTSLTTTYRPNGIIPLETPPVTLSATSTGTPSSLAPTTTAPPTSSFLSDLGGLSATTIYNATTHLDPTSTTTILVPPTDSPDSKSSSSSKSSGLSLGAKIGIAVGAVALVIILLLLALFCLRRRHAKRGASRSEQVMLTQAGHSHNDSRDLITEKEMSTNSPIHDTDTDSGGPPVLPPATRHSALSPYETLPSQPYTGLAAAIPRRKTNSASTSADSETLGRVMTRPKSHRSERTIEIPVDPPSTNEQHDSFLSYSDLPNFPVPSRFTGSFLESEDSRNSNGMSEDEARRIEEARREEEEERRIDAAIAEAERRGPLR